MNEKRLNELISLEEKLRAKLTEVDSTSFTNDDIYEHKLRMVLYTKLFKEIGLLSDDEEWSFPSRKEMRREDDYYFVDSDLGEYYRPYQFLIGEFEWEIRKYNCTEEELREIVPKLVWERFESSFIEGASHEYVDIIINSNQKIGGNLDYVERYPKIKESERHKKVLELLDFSGQPFHYYYAPTTAVGVVDGIYYSIYTIGFFDGMDADLNYISFNINSILCAYLVDVLIERTIQEYKLAE